MRGPLPPPLARLDSLASVGRSAPGLGGPLWLPPRAQLPPPPRRYPHRRGSEMPAVPASRSERGLPSPWHIGNGTRGRRARKGSRLRHMGGASEDRASQTRPPNPTGGSPIDGVGTPVFCMAPRRAGASCVWGRAAPAAGAAGFPGAGRVPGGLAGGRGGPRLRPPPRARPSCAGGRPWPGPVGARGRGRWAPVGLDGGSRAGSPAACRVPSPESRAPESAGSEVGRDCRPASAQLAGPGAR